MNSTTVKDIEEMLSQFGILLDKTEKGQLLFIDTENDEIMKTSLTEKSLQIVPINEKAQITTKEELISINKYICLQSQDKTLEYRLKLKPTKSGEEISTIDEINYQKKKTR